MEVVGDYVIGKIVRVIISGRCILNEKYSIRNY